MKGQNFVFAAADADTSITIRDYIAIQVVAGFAANPSMIDIPYEEMAEMAYKQADAMLKQSEVRCSPQMIAEASCDGNIEKCKGACYK